MSFILDALRKSEHERQRSAMPGIAQVPFGLPRREMPAWALALIALLVIALVTLAGALWRSTWPDAARDRAASAPTRSEVPLALPPVLPLAEPAAASVEPTVTPDADALAIPSASPAPRARQAPAPTAASPPRVSSAGAASFEGRASVPTADDRGDRANAGEPAATAEQTLPSAAALAAQGVSVPTLHLELHAYADRPADRFVFINGTKYAEGATLAEGPKLVTIAPNGAILSYLGHRFLLAPQQ
jgi:general secretion pathway protein B